MTISLEAAAQVMREAMRDTVKRHSLWYLVQSGLMILAGILALVYPAMSSVAVVFFLGWLLIIGGILQAISLIGARHVPHFWLQLVSVVLFVIVGILFLRNPGESLVTLTLLLIVLFMVEGMSKVIFALTIRPLANWGWVLASGIVGIVLACYLWANIPLTAAWIIGVLLGIELISEGIALGLLHVARDGDLVAVLAAAHVEEVVGARVERLAEARRRVLEAEAAPLAAGAEHGDVAAVRVDVHELGIEREHSQRGHSLTVLGAGRSRPCSRCGRASRGRREAGSR